MLRVPAEAVTRALALAPLRGRPLLCVLEDLGG